MNARAVIAGLKMFFPNPPNTILPKTIPNAIPTIAIQRGIVGGRLRAKMVAETKSDSVIRILYFFAIRYSLVTAVATTTASTAIKRHPNR